MRPPKIALNANGFSKWLKHDYYQTPFGVTLGLLFSSGASLTAGVIYTVDDQSPAAAYPIASGSQAVQTVTINDTGDVGDFGTHGMSSNDWITLIGSGVGIDGEYPITFVSATQYTITVGPSQSATLSAGCRVIRARQFPHASLTNQVARATANYVSPVAASKLVVTNYVSGVVWLDVLQGGMSS